MTKQQTNPTGQPSEQTQKQQESFAQTAAPAEKKPFVEPAVSVPADVLEATALFQAPSVQTSIVP